MTQPIPLTTFEEFILWEDRPAYPWSCSFRMQFSGSLDRKILERAVQNVLPRHPLLMSRVQQMGKRWFWVPDDQSEPKWIWERGKPRQNFPSAEYLDLQKEIGLRLLVVEDPEADHCDLTLQFHHACCDGGGIVEFAHELLIAYAIESGTSPAIELPERDPSRLANRGKYGLSFFKLLKMLPKQLVGLKGAFHFVRRDPTSIIPCQVAANDAPLPKGYPASCEVVFDSKQIESLRTSAKRQNATLNDLLIRDLFLGIGEWREQIPETNDDEWLRMMIPMNLRVPEDRLMSAANVVSCIFLDRRGIDLKDPDDLLASIHNQMQLIKGNQLGLTFIFSLSAIRRLPGGLKKAALKDECSNSCIFSNLGRPLLQSPLPKEDERLVAGDVTLEKIDVIPPLRPYNVMSFSANQYAGRLTIAMHYDPRVLSAKDATELLALFRQKADESV